MKRFAKKHVTLVTISCTHPYILTCGCILISGFQKKFKILWRVGGPYMGGGASFPLNSAGMPPLTDPQGHYKGRTWHAVYTTYANTLPVSSTRQADRMQLAGQSCNGHITQ